MHSCALPAISVNSFKAKLTNCDFLYIHPFDHECFLTAYQLTVQLSLQKVEYL